MDILDLIFPKTCLGCGKPPAHRASGPEGEGGYICENCLAKVKVLNPACPYCEKASIDGFTHVKCRKKYGLDGLTSIWKYEGVIKKAILALKYKYSTEAGRELAEVFVRQILNSKFLILNSAALVPVPLYWHRQNIRGFNQSEEIGKIVAQNLGWKFASDLLIKRKPTVSQATISVDERKKNLRGAFSLSPHNSSFIIPNSVVLFDDVFTTGSTLKEVAKVLKRAGVKRVWGLTIAR